ncbi:MAG: preprotein translocase subunit SecG [Deltaproteobacteria bacterium]|nr:preprotein translocase subunit SecG [Deltaproteobacteria bacterium]
MWYTIVTVIHVVACFFLAAVVLLQTGKGSDAGAVFGGSSQTIFGSSGAGNLLTKLTSASAIIFMLTSLTLTYGAAKQSTKSIFDSTPARAPAPAAPESAPAAQTGTSAEGQAAATTPAGEQAPAAPAATTPAASASAAAPPAQPSPSAATEPAAK